MVMGLEEMVASIFVLLINLEEYCLLLKLAMEVFTKLSPVRVRVNPGLPAMIDEGVIDNREGTGFLTKNLNGFDCLPPGEELEAVTSR
jgi:hypothetical protein